MSLDTLSGLVGQTVIRIAPCGQTSKIPITRREDAVYLFSFQTLGYTLKVI